MSEKERDRWIDRAIDLAAGAIAEVDWPVIHDNKFTRLRVTRIGGQPKELIAENNTQLLAQLIAFWSKHQ